MNQLKNKYNTEIASSLKKEFNLSSIMEVPKLEKIVINKGVGSAANDSKNLEVAMKELELITGQKPVITKAKKSIASFKLREGQGIGCKVTLRGDKMWAFVETLFNVALPRVRDFRGLSNKSFDSLSNYTFGVKEQIIFPQIVYDNVKQVGGYDITFVISNSKSKEQSRSLLKHLGAPFQRIKGEK